MSSILEDGLFLGVGSTEPPALRGVPITSLIISYFFFSSSLSGVTFLFQLNDIEWSWQSNTISPSLSLLTFIVLSFLVILKLQGLQEHFIPLGLISISFLNCILPWQIGQSITINLLVNLCSLVSVMVLGSSSLKTSSSGIALLCFLFGGIYIYF